MAGDGALCPEGQPLKALRAVFQAVCHPPAAGPTPVTAVTSQHLEATIMKANIAERPAQPAGMSIPPGLAQQERDRLKALRRLARLREKAAAEIERLLAFLDASDPYVTTELEKDDSDFEPSLGSHEIARAGGVSYLASRARVAGYDIEQDDADLEPDVDDEPSLGALEGHDNQAGIAWDATHLGHGSHDREEACDDEGVTA